jgi:hypothetical protein
MARHLIETHAPETGRSALNQLVGPVAPRRASRLPAAAYSHDRTHSGMLDPLGIDNPRNSPYEEWSIRADDDLRVRRLPHALTSWTSRSRGTAASSR